MQRRCRRSTATPVALSVEPARAHASRTLWRGRASARRASVGGGRERAAVAGGAVTEAGALRSGPACHTNSPAASSSRSASSPRGRVARLVTRPGAPWHHWTRIGKSSAQNRSAAVGQLTRSPSRSASVTAVSSAACWTSASLSHRATQRRGAASGRSRRSRAQRRCSGSAGRDGTGSRGDSRTPGRYGTAPAARRRIPARRRPSGHRPSARRGGGPPASSPGRRRTARATGCGHSPRRDRAAGSSFSGVGSSFHETSSTPTSPCRGRASRLCRRVPGTARVARPRQPRALVGPVPRGHRRLRPRTSSRALVAAGRVEAAAGRHHASRRLQCQRRSDRRPPPRGLHPSASRKRARAWRHRRAASPGAYADDRPPLIGRAPPAAQEPARGASASARGLARSVTGPRRTLPPVVYANRTSRSPSAVSSNSTMVANRRPPACWATLTRSTDAALPHGVVIVVFIRGNVATTVCRECDALRPSLRRIAAAPSGARSKSEARPSSRKLLRRCVVPVGQPQCSPGTVDRIRLRPT